MFIDLDVRHTARCLKSKEPRLRDWNLSDGEVPEALRLSWNQKNLDYEIETEIRQPVRRVHRNQV